MKNDIFRINKKCHSEYKEYSYVVVGIGESANINIDETLMDLSGNQFKVKDVSIQGEILPEYMDGTAVSGTILLRGPTNINFIFCNNPLNSYRVDEEYLEEYQAAGLNHSCALFSYESLLQGKLSLFGEDIKGLTVYRGWMMSPDMYKKFYELLSDRGIILINSPDEYNRYHLLPEWYNDFKNDTPFSIWNESGNIKEIMEKAEGLEGAFIVKDYVKSRKHEWYDACFIKDISENKEAERVIGNFINRQADDMVGGVVLRKFEKLKSVGVHADSKMPLSQEYRVFVYVGKILCIDNYWTEDTDIDISDEEYVWIESIAGKIESNFVTIDIARKSDGRLIIMEMGDGQISGLQQISPEGFYRAFEGQDRDNLYSIETVKTNIRTLVDIGKEPELTITFRGSDTEYKIIGYDDHASFQRCEYENRSGEIEYNDLDELFESELIDGICLKRDWFKVNEVWCDPSMDKLDFKIDQYKAEAESGKKNRGARYPICRLVKTEINKWDPYGLFEGYPIEYDISSISIASDIEWNTSIGEIAKLISDEFKNRYEDIDYFSVKNCMPVAKAIKRAMKEFKEKRKMRAKLRENRQ